MGLFRYQVTGYRFLSFTFTEVKLLVKLTVTLLTLRAYTGIEPIGVGFVKNNLSLHYIKMEVICVVVRRTVCFLIVLFCIQYVDIKTITHKISYWDAS